MSPTPRIPKSDGFPRPIRAYDYVIWNPASTAPGVVAPEAVGLVRQMDGGDALVYWPGPGESGLLAGFSKYFTVCDSSFLLGVYGGQMEGVV